MGTLILESTRFTPKVTLDPDSNVYEISGDSRPENTHSFYSELIEWVENWDRKNSNKEEVEKPIRFKFAFEYLNSSSSKFVLKLILKLKEILVSGDELEIDWYYDEPDIDMKEMGEEYAEMAEIPINLIPVEV